MTITPHEAFGLTLIALSPIANKDLIETLSKKVQPVGRAIIGEKSSDREINEAAAAMLKWAKGRSKVL